MSTQELSEIQMYTKGHGHRKYVSYIEELCKA